MIEALQREVVDLRAQLNRHSGNSSQPPSQDPPWKTPSPGKPGTRRRGGQPGHKGHKRELVEPDDIVEIRPTECHRCRTILAGADGAPFRHQVTEVPEVRARVTEYRLHSLACSQCHASTVGTLPEGVPRGAFGPRLQAMLAVCSGAYHLSKRDIRQLASDYCQAIVKLTRKRH